MTDWASMDNSPRNRYLDRGGTAVDTSAEMALFARNLARIATLLSQQKAAAGFRADAEKLTRLINEKMWDPQRYLRSPQRVGTEKLWFGQTTASLVCDAPNAEGRRTVRVQTDGRFRLKLFYQRVLRQMDIPAGQVVEIQLEPSR